MRNILLAAALAGALSACSGGPEGAVTVRDPWARETVPGVQVSAGYARIENGTGAPIRLTGAETPVAGRVEVHNVIMDRSVMRMRPVDGGLEIPAGQTVELRPGGYHIMLLALRRPLRAGERIPLTLRFEGAPAVRTDFPVRSAAEGGRHE